MLRVIAIACALLTSTGCASTPKPSDEMALRALPQQFSEAWADHDSKALADIMSADVDFVNVGAIWTHGVDFETYHNRILSGRFSKSTNTLLETNVRFLRPDLAIVRWSWKIEGELDAAGEPLGARYGLMTMIAEKTGGGWAVVAAQNTNAGPPRSEADGLIPPIVVPRNSG